MKLHPMWLFTVVAGLSGVACVNDKIEPEKGVLEDEPTPGTTEALTTGNVVPLVLESQHPYANNLAQNFTVSVAGLVPACTRQVRLHFASIRTEATYDFLRVLGPTGVVVQSFDGDQTNLWSSWIDLDASKKVTLRLETDYSITRDGFRIDSFEYTAWSTCPAIVFPACASDQLDLNASLGVCDCPRPPTCVSENQVTIEHSSTAGTIGHRVAGDTAYNVTASQVVALGAIDHDRVQAVLRAMVDARLLDRPDVVESASTTETLKLQVGPVTHTFTRALGTFPTGDAALIASVEELFACGGTGALTCGAGFTCKAGQCAAVGPACICISAVSPVCGVDGQTYFNACEAGCASVAVRHAGECGIAGDVCGGLSSAACVAGNKCRYGAGTWAAPFPNAAGTCVAQTYCDAPADCVGQAHPSVSGTWACSQNVCGWVAGPAWQPVTGWSFSTAHPYANQASVYVRLVAPAGATKVRFVVNGLFELESGYDFLEVQRANGLVLKRYTGTVGPALADELTGNDFWLRLATDSSITKYGFNLTAQWSN